MPERVNEAPRYVTVQHGQTRAVNALSNGTVARHQIYRARLQNAFFAHA